MVEVEAVAKLYRLGVIGATTVKESLARYRERLGFKKAKNAANGARRKPDAKEFWALKDVSFVVQPGEVVGLIGHNGAGKSTLLKILSRITDPTQGRVVMRGQVASLLEVGTGFHPDLTGRENVFLNGAILGMRKAEITRKFDEIVEFAEVGKFIDTPVKRYSSGMYVRLAFAVAAHLQPEILLVDEVLAVGDVAFQKKCLGKMGDVAQQGRTIIFVSHNLAAVQNLCQRAIWLDQGQIVAQGDVRAIVPQYLQTSSQVCTETVWPDRDNAPGTDEVRLESVRLVAEGAGSVAQIAVNTPFTIEASYWNLQAETKLNVSIAVYNQEGVCAFISSSVNDPHWQDREFPAGLFRSKCRIPGYLLNYGTYTVVLYVVKDAGVLLYRHEKALTFEVQDITEDRGGWYGNWLGVARPRLTWATEMLRE